MNMPLNAPNRLVIKHDIPCFFFIFYFCIYFPFHFPLLISTNVFISVYFPYVCMHFCFTGQIYLFLTLAVFHRLLHVGQRSGMNSSSEFILNEYNIKSGSAAVAYMCFTVLREHEIHHASVHFNGKQVCFCFFLSFLGCLRMSQWVCEKVPIRPSRERRTHGWVSDVETSDDPMQTQCLGLSSSLHRQ